MKPEDRGIFRVPGAIDQLVGIDGEIVKLLLDAELAGCQLAIDISPGPHRLDEHRIGRLGGIDGQGLTGVVVEGGAPGRRGVGEGRHQAAAVERVARQGARQVQNGGRQVEIGDQLAPDLIRRDAGPAHDQRHPDRLFVEHEFPADAMRRLRITVVRCDDDNGVGQLRRGQRPHHVPHHFVDGHQAFAALAEIIGVLIERRGIEWRKCRDEARLVGHIRLVEAGPRRHVQIGEVTNVTRRRNGGDGVAAHPWSDMGRNGGHHHEEWFGGGGLPRQERQRLAPQDGCAVVEAARSIMFDEPVFVHVIIVVARRTGHRAPFIPARNDVGWIGIAVAIHEFSDEGRRIAGLLQPDAEVIGLARSKHRIGRGLHIMAALTGEKRRARRHAE